MHGSGLFIQNSSQQLLRSTCMRALPADDSPFSILILLSGRKCPPSGLCELLSSLCDIEGVPGDDLRVSVGAAAGIETSLKVNRGGVERSRLDSSCRTN